ncbi:MAG: FIG00461530: hypothetical protein [uncultured Paraburkholderia sp.]|nr:MAG: FIG00461530: hypothetical protein [uncultured Paraburkholderia sp.]
MNQIILARRELCSRAVDDEPASPALDKEEEAGGAIRCNRRAHYPCESCAVPNFQVTPMQILFPNESPEYSGRELTLAFPALVDGQRVECIITAEALEDHFGAASPRLEDMVGAFHTHRERIEAATRRLLSETSAQCVMLRSGYVRFYEANWRA